MQHNGLSPGITVRRLKMKAENPDHESRDVTFAGLLIISLFSMCIGIFLGMLVA